MDTTTIIKKKVKPVKVLKIKLYIFDQLGEQAKEKALDHYRNGNSEPAWSYENRITMEQFAELFDIRVIDWSYGDRGEGVTFVSNYRGEIEEMSAQRLATWLYNNIGDKLYKRKYMGSVDLKKIVNHKNVKGKDYKTGNFYNPYYSAILKETSCVLTGYYMDDIILGPIYKFIDKPDNTNLMDLLENCFNAWIKGCNDDIEWLNSEEYISEHFEANEYLFEIDGKMNNG